MGLPASLKRKPQHLAFLETTVQITSVAVKRKHGYGNCNKEEFPTRKENNQQNS